MRKGNKASKDDQSPTGSSPPANDAPDKVEKPPPKQPEKSARKNDTPPGNLLELFLRPVWNTRLRWPVIGVLVLVALYMAWPHIAKLRAILPTSHPFPTHPVIVSIQPDTEFGGLRADGLTRGLTSTSALSIVRLNADLNDMKSREVEAMLDRLRQRIESHSVLAIVGPSISECTNDFLDLVESTNQRIPVIIESSSPRDTIRWNDRPFPVFRLSSGIDERAIEIARMTRQLIDSGRTVAILIERVSNAASFGELLFQYIRKHLDADSIARLEIHYFDHSKPEELVRRKDLNNLFAGETVIFHLGLGNDFQMIMDTFFREEHAANSAHLIGVMCAYRSAPAMQQERYLRAQILELTDMPISVPEEDNLARDAFCRAYGKALFDPALRDQAFSFDAGYCLAMCMEQLTLKHESDPGMTYEEALAFISELLSTSTFCGATGLIRLSEHDEAPGQNHGTALQLVRMTDQDEWEAVTLQQLIEAPGP